jgi:hypothetical protein
MYLINIDTVNLWLCTWMRDNAMNIRRVAETGLFYTYAPMTCLMVTGRTVSFPNPLSAVSRDNTWINRSKPLSHLLVCPVNLTANPHQRNLLHRWRLGHRRLLWCSHLHIHNLLLKSVSFERFTKVGSHTHLANLWCDVVVDVGEDRVSTERARPALSGFVGARDRRMHQHLTFLFLWKIERKIWMLE